MNKKTSEMIGALLLILLLHRLEVLKGVLMKGDEGLDLSLEESWQD